MSSKETLAIVRRTLIGDIHVTDTWGGLYEEIRDIADRIFAAAPRIVEIRQWHQKILDDDAYRDTEDSDDINSYYTENRAGGLEPIMTGELVDKLPKAALKPIIELERSHRGHAREVRRYLPPVRHYAGSALFIRQDAIYHVPDDDLLSDPTSYFQNWSLEKIINPIVPLLPARPSGHEIMAIKHRALDHFAHYIPLIATGLEEMMIGCDETWDEPEDEPDGEDDGL